MSFAPNTWTPTKVADVHRCVLFFWAGADFCVCQDVHDCKFWRGLGTVCRKQRRGLLGPRMVLGTHTVLMYTDTYDLMISNA